MTILPAWIIDHENRKRRERKREQELLWLPIYPLEPSQPWNDDQDFSSALPKGLNTTANWKRQQG